VARSARQAVREAPVTTLTTIESVVGFVLTFLVTHHVIGNIDIGSTTQTLAPVVALVLPAIFGSAKWRLVSPAAKVQDAADHAGAMSDADYARIEAMIDERLRDAAPTQQPAELTGADDPLPVTPRPAGMSAGDVERHRPRHERHRALTVRH
jgi:hypothetical protein